MSRKLWYPLSESVTQESVHSITDKPLNPFSWGSVDNTTPIEFIGKLSLDEYIKLSSAVDVGSDIAYPDNSPEILYIWHKLIQSFTIPTGDNNCRVIPAFSNSLEYFYNNPYETTSPTDLTRVAEWVTFQTLVDIFPKWLQDLYNLFGGVDALDLRLGYRQDDVFYVPNPSLSLLSPTDFINSVLSFPSQLIPSIVIRVRGSGTIRANLLSTPLGGSVVGLVDRPLSEIDTLNAWLSGDFSVFGNFQSAELQRDIIQFPPETVADVTMEWTISDDADHIIELLYFPRFNDSLDFLGFGGGFRSFEICEGFEVIDDSGIIIKQSDDSFPKVGYLSTIYAQLDKELQKTETVGKLQDNVTKANEANAGLYGFALDLGGKLNDVNNRTKAYVWQDLDILPVFNSPFTEIQIPAGYERYRLTAVCVTSNSPSIRLLMRCNNVSSGASYHSWNSNNDEPNEFTNVIGYANDNLSTQVDPNFILEFEASETNRFKRFNGTTVVRNPIDVTKYSYHDSVVTWRNNTEDLNSLQFYAGSGTLTMNFVQLQGLQEIDVQLPVSVDPPIEPPTLDDVTSPSDYIPVNPDWYYYTIDDITDFPNVPGSYAVSGVVGNPAPSLVDTFGAQGGGNFQIEPSQPINVRRVTYQVYVATYGQYEFDRLRVIVYDTSGGVIETNDIMLPIPPEQTWTRFYHDFTPSASLSDRVLFQPLVQSGSGASGDMIIYIDNIYIEGILP